MDMALECSRGYLELRNIARERRLRNLSLADAIILVTA